MSLRPLKTQERNIIRNLLKNSGQEESYKIFDFVEELPDGKMGSIPFVSSKPNRAYNSDLVQVEYTDVDNIAVLITLTIDNNNDLFELEFWKVNFERLFRYPKPEEILYR